MKCLNVSLDTDLLDAISAEFDLRKPNKEALFELVSCLYKGYDPQQMQVLNLATGVGKTYLMAAFIEYLRRQGVGNVMIVTPGKTVQSKTVQNFTQGSPRYIAGSPLPPEVVTPQDYSNWVSRQNGPAELSFGTEIPMLAFIFNIQQLIAPKNDEGETHGSGADAMRRKPRRFDENAGILFDYLKNLDDLVVIADESHLYGSSAKAFNAALKELNPAASIGLTASVDKKTDHVIYEYPLYRAIQDKFVKAPVLAFRKEGYGEDESSEEQQLRDAMQLRAWKQNYYDIYIQAEKRPHLNAVMFVVCADVDHATQVAGLLRTPEFFGREDAVLQVDSKHEDEQTQHRLENLDRPDSPVLAVVSVNKLKEGWDVKNIAVVVTLRAMASEVLTQQTMGRGLRLPFGKYTGEQHIDQLDIIAHQSFKELLEAENVLQQFGLDEGVSAADQARVKTAINQLAGGSDAGQAAFVWTTGTGQAASTGDNNANSVDFDGTGSQDSSASDAVSPYLFDGEEVGMPGLGIRAITETDYAPINQWQKPVEVGRNEKFADVTYKFPVTIITTQQRPIDLSEIDDSEIRRAAEKVTSTGDVLHRAEIIAALGKKLRIEDRESANVDSVHITREEAEESLVKLVVNIPLVPRTPENPVYIKEYLVPKFMSYVTFAQWTVKSLGSAREELGRLIREYCVRILRETKEVPEVYAIELPGQGYTLDMGEKIHDQITSRTEFKAYRFYGGWYKSLFEAESFDSYSGEYVLAKLLNTSPNIVWWHRLHTPDRAYIYYNPKDRYFPDFVACDSDGVMWIIEGKDARGRENDTVQAKRKAAEQLVRKLLTVPEFAGQKWGYLIAYEDDTERAESWDDLKAMAQPVTNVI